MSTDVVVSPKVVKNLKSVQKYIAGLEIKSSDDMVTASEYLRLIADAKKQVEEQRTEITKPLNASLRSTNALFKKWSKPLDEADEMIRHGMSLYQNGLIVKNTTSEIPNSYGDVHFVTTHEFIVNDITKVPRQYMMVDMDKVKEAIASGKKVAGIEVLTKRKPSL